MSDEDYETVSAYYWWYWDCPFCQEVVCEEDIEPSGVMDCPNCGETVRFS